MFAALPYHYGAAEVDAILDKLPTIAALPQARGVLLLNDSDAVVGASWGVVTQPGLSTSDHPFHALYQRFAADARETPVGRVEVVELFVHADHQGAGHGRKLLDAFVGGHPAWLLTYPDASALQAYLRWAWTEHSRVGGDGKPLVLMTKESA